MRTRRIVQIATSGDNLYALCDDGTVWQYSQSVFAWQEHSRIPQPRLADPFEGVGVVEQPEGDPSEKLL